MQEQQSLIDEKVKIKVSSTLNKDTKQFGKQNLIDGTAETCWNSDQGAPQFVVLQWDKDVLPQRLVVEFQGGFAGKNCACEYYDSTTDEFKLLCEFYPVDASTRQEFPIDVKSQRWLKRMRIVFKDSTDFYGRITIYNLGIVGMQKNMCPF